MGYRKVMKPSPQPGKRDLVFKPKRRPASGIENLDEPTLLEDSYNKWDILRFILLIAFLAGWLYLIFCLYIFG